MPSSVVAKNPVKQRAGLEGAKRRWGEPPVIDLAEFTPAQRRLILALVAAAKAESGGTP